MFSAAATADYSFAMRSNPMNGSPFWCASGNSRSPCGSIPSHSGFSTNYERHYVEADLGGDCGMRRRLNFIRASLYDVVRLEQVQKVKPQGIGAFRFSCAVACASLR